MNFVSSVCKMRHIWTVTDAYQIMTYTVVTAPWQLNLRINNNNITLILSGSEIHIRARST
jgi:hypothetical protein